MSGPHCVDGMKKLDRLIQTIYWYDFFKIQFQYCLHVCSLLYVYIYINMFPFSFEFRFFLFSSIGYSVCDSFTSHSLFVCIIYMNMHSSDFPYNWMAKFKYDNIEMIDQINMAKKKTIIIWPMITEALEQCIISIK